MNRKTSRESVMKIVYKTEFTDMYDEKFIKSIKMKFSKKEYDVNYIANVLEEFLINKASIDEYISKNLKGWSITRISKVDLAILRVAMIELFYISDIPVGVTINEAVELSKKYSDIKSSKFINGILGSINRDKEKTQSE